jgi:hypothetical protein
MVVRAATLKLRSQWMRPTASGLKPQVDARPSESRSRTAGRAAYGGTQARCRIGHPRAGCADHSQARNPTRRASRGPLLSAKSKVQRVVPTSRRRRATRWKSETTPTARGRASPPASWATSPVKRRRARAVTPSRMPFGSGPSRGSLRSRVGTTVHRALQLLERRLSMEVAVRQAHASFETSLDAVLEDVARACCAAGCGAAGASALHLGIGGRFVGADTLLKWICRSRSLARRAVRGLQDRCAPAGRCAARIPRMCSR